MTQEQRQGHFEKVWAWFVTKKKPPSWKKHRGSSTTGQCLYKGPRKAMCAFALVVPEEHRGLLEEGNSARRMLDKSAKLRRVLDVDDQTTSYFFGRSDTDFFSQLQGAHDGAAGTTCGNRKAFTTLVEDRLRSFAQVFSLHVPPAKARRTT